MKNIYYILLIVMCSTSCNDDFLNLAPETELTSGTFYKTENHFQQALSAAYQPLRGIVTNGIYMDEMRSDNTFFSYYPQDRSFYWTETLALFLDDENGGYSSDRWNNNYVGIARLNMLMARLKNSEFSNEFKDNILGEALFLRAFYYYDLVQHYGGVPIHLEPTITEEDAFLPRSSINDVYNQIIMDLEASIPKLSIPNSFPQSGKATQGAAKMLLAYAYMSKPDREYAKAETQLRSITTMNYALLENYSDVFDLANENSKESIFEIQYKEGDTGQQNDYDWRFIPRMSNTDFLMGVLFSNVYNSGWNVPTQEMIDSYEIGDLRLNASIAVLEGTSVGDVMYGETVKEVRDFTPTPGKAYQYFIKKYHHPPYEKALNTGTNWPVFRYSDALLLLAECLVEQGKNAEALSYLNQVRNRAGLPDLPEATKENIANERRHELAFENHRWTDLIRIGKAVEVLTKHGQLMKSLYGWILPTAFNVTSEKLIYPIPYRELQINKLLEQNPGY